MWVNAALVVAFLCELAMLAGLAIIGADRGGAVGSGTVGSGTVGSIGLAIALPLAVFVLWGLLLAPKASRRLPRVPRLAVKLVLFTGTGLGLVAVGYPVLGLALALTAAVSVTVANARSQLV